jgi:isocitrate lyase
MKAVLSICRKNGVKIVTNMGAANPVAAAQATRDIARALGLTGLKVAAVTGDDVLDQARMRPTSRWTKAAPSKRSATA